MHVIFLSNCAKTHVFFLSVNECCYVCIYNVCASPQNIYSMRKDARFFRNSNYAYFLRIFKLFVYLKQDLIGFFYQIRSPRTSPYDGSFFRNRPLMWCVSIVHHQLPYQPRTSTLGWRISIAIRSLDGYSNEQFVTKLLPIAWTTTLRQILMDFIFEILKMYFKSNYECNFVFSVAVFTCRPDGYEAHKAPDWEKQ